MAFRPAFLIGPVLLALAGWAGTASKPAAEKSCGGCHTPHFAGSGTCAACHRGDPLALRKEIAHHNFLTGRAAEQGLVDASAVAEGRRRVEQLACRRCHVVGGTGNRFATDLDRIAWRREQRELARAISTPVENMPRFGLEERQAEAVIAFLLNGADPDRAEATYRVRFSGGGENADSVVESRCGGCHRAYTAGGPVGKGSAGPNLSGIFTPFYPSTAPGSLAWTGGALGRWLENPRSVKPRAVMRPVRLEAGEHGRLVRELGGPVGAEPKCPGARDG